MIVNEMNRFRRMKHSRLTNWRGEQEYFLFLLRSYGSLENLIRVKRSRVQWLQDCLQETKDVSERRELIGEIQDQLNVLILAERVCKRMRENVNKL